MTIHQIQQCYATIIQTHYPTNTYFVKLIKPPTEFPTIIIPTTTTWLKLV